MQVLYFKAGYLTVLSVSNSFHFEVAGLSKISHSFSFLFNWLSFCLFLIKMSAPTFKAMTFFIFFPKCWYMKKNIKLIFALAEI